MAHNKDHGIVRDDKGQEQPKDKKRAQQSGVQEQKDAAKQPEITGTARGRGIVPRMVDLDRRKRSLLTHAQWCEKYDCARSQQSTPPSSSGTSARIYLGFDEPVPVWPGERVDPEPCSPSG